MALYDDVKTWRVRPGKLLRDPRGGVYGPGTELEADHPAVVAQAAICDVCLPVASKGPAVVAPVEQPVDVEADEPAFEEECEG